MTIESEIRNPRGRIFRRLFIKRRLATTGLFETNWLDISEDVKRWGKISKSIDAIQYNKVKFSDVNIVMANDRGIYNPEDDEASLWYGYASQQRTLVKIETGFVHQTLSSSGIYTNTEYPTNPVAFVGFIYGDINISDSNEITFPVKPLTEVFRTFPTANLTGYTTTGMTANQFITMLRDQTDGSANFLFRPFFGDTTTNWQYTSSSIVYPDVRDTSTSVAPGGQENDFYRKNCWEAIEKLAETENQVPYITRDGAFIFADREPNTSTAQFEFFGRGVFANNYGQTIKQINKYSKKMSNYYSRVEVKWIQVHTTTAVVATQTSSMVVSGTNTAWNFGHKTYKLENYWIQTLTSAQTLANNIFSHVSARKAELEFTTTYVPHLELLDRVAVSYQSSSQTDNDRWDVFDWADDASSDPDDLIWPLQSGDALRFDAMEFKLVSIDLNLDSLDTKFIGIEI